MGLLGLLIDVVLGAAVVGCAVVALVTPRESRAVGWYVAFGLALAVASGRLGAGDVAATEALVGAAATGGLLWRVVRDTRQADTESLAADV